MYMYNVQYDSMLEMISCTLPFCTHAGCTIVLSSSSPGTRGADMMKEIRVGVAIAAATVATPSGKEQGEEEMRGPATN